MNLLHPVERDGQLDGYLWEYGPTRDEHYIQLPLAAGFRSPSTFRLSFADLTGLTFLSTNKRKLLKRQRAQMVKAKEEDVGRGQQDMDMRMVEAHQGYEQ